jgi:hypothetical protein
MTASTNRKMFAAACGLLLAGHRVVAQAPTAATPVPPPPAGGAVTDAAPPIGSEFPLWLRPPGSDVEGLEPRQEGRGENGSEERIETDRDSFTPATTTAGRRRLIVESAHTFLDNRGVPETHSFPEFLLRYGVGERFELRLGWNYEVGGAASDVSGSFGDEFAEESRIEREHRIAYGAKARLTEQRGWLPVSAVILQGFTPTGGEATDTQLVATSVIGWELPNRWQFDAASRFATGSESDDRFDIWAPSAVLKVPVGERWNLHGEYFGLFSRNKAEDFVIHYFSPGAHFLITPDLEVGVRVGWGLNDQAARFFCNAGLGWRY